jgi:diguanylate cyclase (GGDEF)-like protein/PAS domain S-box-containing protein
MVDNQSGPSQMERQRLRLLYVEDAVADFELCVRELERGNLDVRAERVTTRQEYEALLDSNTYDIILADYRLPGWNGMEAFEILRRRGVKTPLILVTGALGDEKAVECIRKGVTDYILKDRLSALPGAVCRALEEKKIRDERNRAETALRESERRFRILADTIASALFIYQGTQCRYANQAAEMLTGYSQQELLALGSWDLVHPDSRSLVIDKGLEHLSGGQGNARYEMKILTKQGEARWLDVTVGKIEFDGQPAGLNTAFDITERKLSEMARGEHGARDPLTGLADRSHLQEIFHSEVKRTERTSRSFALLVLELDGLKQMNEMLGYPVGSRALCSLANVIGSSCRSTDSPARSGENEFAIILPETSTAGARQVAQRILERLKVDGGERPFSVSTGMAVFPKDGGTLEQLLVAGRKSWRRPENRIAGKLAVSA